MKAEAVILRLRLFVSISVLCLSCTSSYGQQLVRSWSPDSFLAAQLAPETQLAGYAFHPPAGLKPSPIDVMQVSGATVSAIQFSGVQRVDGTSPVFSVSITSLPAGRVLSGPDIILDVLTRRNLVGHDNIVMSKREYSQVGGMPAARLYFKYTLPSGRMAHGCLYGIIDGSNNLNFYAMDTEPYNQATIPLIETTFLTTRALSPSDASPSVAANPNVASLGAVAVHGLPGGDVSFLGYMMHPPSDYGFADETVPGSKYTLLMWHGPAEDTGRAPVLCVEASHADGDDSDTAARAGLKSSIEQLQQKFQDIRATPVQSGSLNGMMAYYLYWQGTGGPNHPDVILHGFMYSLVDKSFRFVISGVDGEPYSKSSLPVMETAVRTFHK